MSDTTVPRWYRIYAYVVVGATIVLIWWGAAVTTENVGMAVPDWPLSFGTINPKGWWLVPALRLEHGHRLIASVVGLMTLGLCAGAWFGTRHRALRIATSVAVVLVILQGVLGGMRVLRISDEFGIVHGCLGQAFFCLLLLVTLMSHSWQERGTLPASRIAPLRGASSALFGAVFFQLILGAVLRHTQRFHLADDGLLLTGTSWFPGWGEPDLLVLFLHKWWAVAVFAFVMAFVAWTFPMFRKQRGLGSVGLVLAAAVIVQVLLGVAVVLTGKSFWVTNFHVINGLLILAATFVVLVRSWRARPEEIRRSTDAFPV